MLENFSKNLENEINSERYIPDNDIILIENDEIDSSIDPNTLPDCLQKYKLILKRSKKMNIKFSDKNFPPDD